MSHHITIYDESLSGERTESLSLDLMSSTITLRELIRRRVYEEVQDYNASTPEYFQGFVQPTDTERMLNGYRVKERWRIAEAGMMLETLMLIQWMRNRLFP